LCCQARHVRVWNNSYINVYIILVLYILIIAQTKSCVHIIYYKQLIPSVGVTVNRVIVAYILYIYIQYTHSWNQMTVRSNKEMKGKKEPVRVVSPSLWTSRVIVAFIRHRVWEYARERARALVCACGSGWVAAGRVKGSAVHRKSAAAATSTSLFESRGLTLTCVTTTTTSKVLNGDFIFRPTLRAYLSSWI